MDKSTDRGGFVSNRERRQAVIDCSDLMLGAFMSLHPTEGQMARFLLILDLQHEIVAEMATIERLRSVFQNILMEVEREQQS